MSENQHSLASRREFFDVHDLGMVSTSSSLVYREGEYHIDKHRKGRTGGGCESDRFRGREDAISIFFQS